MGRIPLIAGNWKMNKTVGEAIDLVRQLKASISGKEGVEVAVAPLSQPFMLFIKNWKALPFGLPLRTSSGKRKEPTQARFPHPCSKSWAANT